MHALSIVRMRRGGCWIYVDVPVIHMGMIVGRRGGASIRIRPLQTTCENERGVVTRFVCCAGGNYKENAHAPLEALQSHNPRLRIRLVSVGLTDFTLPKEVYLPQRGSHEKFSCSVSNARGTIGRHKTRNSRTHAPARSFSIARSTAGWYTPAPRNVSMTCPFRKKAEKTLS